MADTITKQRRSWNMSRIRSKNTSPELIVRKRLSSMGVRYRLHVKDLPGKPDIAIKKIKTAMFINGCFWHQHTNCKRSTQPKSNTSYWDDKLKKNRERQKNVVKQLQNDSWRVITIWECETKNDALLSRKTRFLTV